MKVKYKYQEPEIVIKPNVYGMFDYIARNIKTNLIWVCLVRKLGTKYIIEDIYIPPQNVNEWAMCTFDENHLSRVTYSRFENDYRVCNFNMIGRFRMEKSVEIDDYAYKEFDKIAHPLLDECLMMQLNNKHEMSFAISRKSTFLSDLGYTIDMEDFIDKGAFKLILDSKIGKYTYKSNTQDKENLSAYNMSATNVNREKKTKVEPKSMLLLEKVDWKSIL